MSLPTILRIAALLLAAALGAGCATAPAPLAQPSRLDSVPQAALLRICTPGDYKPSASRRPTVSSKASTWIW